MVSHIMLMFNGLLVFYMILTSDMAKENMIFTFSEEMHVNCNEITFWFVWSPVISTSIVCIESRYVLFWTFLQFQRRNRIYKEEQRKLRAAARKAKEGGEGIDTHHH